MEMPPDMRDVYFGPEYVALHAIRPGQEGVLFHYWDGQLHWLYPFVVLENDLTKEDQQTALPTVDIQSAYGYGGPLANNQSTPFLQAAHLAFRSWCEQNRVVAEFVRCHPILSNQDLLDPEVEITVDRETRSLTLGSLDEGFPPFDSKTRNMIRRAESSGVVVQQIEPCASSLQDFVRMYDATMDRVRADTEYRFSEEYFAHLWNMLAEQGLLLVVLLGSRWVASAVFFYGSRTLHYHLSAQDTSTRIPGTINLLLWRAAMIGQKAGLRLLHLGGGRTRAGNDSLLRFKRSMSNGSHQFLIGKRIQNPVAYEALKRTWSDAHPMLVPKFGHRLLCYHEEG